MFKVEDTVFNAIAQYLIERPYKDVMHLVNDLQKCEKIEGAELKPLPEPTPEPELEDKNDEE